MYMYLHLLLIWGLWLP